MSFPTNNGISKSNTSVRISWPIGMDTAPVFKLLASSSNVNKSGTVKIARKFVKIVKNKESCTFPFAKLQITVFARGFCLFVWWFV